MSFVAAFWGPSAPKNIPDSSVQPYKNNFPFFPTTFIHFSPIFHYISMFSLKYNIPDSSVTSTTISIEMPITDYLLLYLCKNFYTHRKNWPFCPVAFFLNPPKKSSLVEKKGHPQKTVKKAYLIFKLSDFSNLKRIWILYSLKYVPLSRFEFIRLGLHVEISKKRFRNFAKIDFWPTWVLFWNFSIVFLYDPIDHLYNGKSCSNVQLLLIQILVFEFELNDFYVKFCKKICGINTFSFITPERIVQFQKSLGRPMENWM